MGSLGVRALPQTRSFRHRGGVFSVIATMMIVMIPLGLGTVARASSSQRSDAVLEGVTIRGTVLDSSRKAIGGAPVRLEQQGVSGPLETHTDAAGGFAFLSLRAGSYTLSVKISGEGSRSATVTVLPQDGEKRIDLILENSQDSGMLHADSNISSAAPSQTMEFADKPNFTVAGVTDWTAAGGHGSDSSLRTSEALTRKTLTLKPEIRRT
jgi:hypothetical protein